MNLKCSVVAWDVLKDPESGLSSELTKTAFCRGLNTDMTYWDFFQHPDNHFRHRRFGYVMQGMAAIQPTDMIFKGTKCKWFQKLWLKSDIFLAFDWNSLPKDSVVVDVGGGIGIATMPLAQRFPDLNIVIQDLPKVVDEGKKVFIHVVCYTYYENHDLPSTFSSGLINSLKHSIAGG